MKYGKVIPAVFISRPNRFIANVRVGEGTAVAHVKNTGRCRELLPEGARVYLSVSDNPARKTKYDLIAVEKTERFGEPLTVNMDSQIPNDVAAEWVAKSGVFSPNAVIRREVTWGKSRFDIYVEDGDRRAFIEVKGVTLENGGIAAFPDAPTTRGVKHINELAACICEGFEAYLLFVVQMKGISRVRPNDATDPDFGQALRRAAECGVRVMAVDCTVTPDSIEADALIPVEL